MSVNVTYESKLTVVETLTDTYLDAADKTVKHSGMNVSETYTALTSVPVTKVASFQKALSTGSGSIDLRALTGTNGASIDGNGLKVQLAKFRNKSTNANDITIAEGASNGYPLLGADFTLTLKPGQEMTLNLVEQAADIDGTHKILDLTGTGSQILECEIVMG